MSRVPDLGSVPLPVARYLARALQAGQPVIRRLRLEQIGRLRTSAHSPRWLPFRATQVTEPVGFMWDAHVSIAPLLHLQVLDAYAGGSASSRVKLLSVIPLASEQGRPELNSGALHRYLAEAAWYPTALLPGSGLRWTPISSTEARGSLTHNGVTVSLDFQFNGTDEVASVYTPARWQKVRDGYRQTPWEARFHAYERKENMLVPSGGDVGWYEDGVWQKVWTGKVVHSEYEFFP